MLALIRWMLLAGCWLLLTLSLPGRADGVLALLSTGQAYEPSPVAVYRMDATARTPAELPADGWQPVPGATLNLGYVDAAVWLHWQVQRGADLPAQWFLVVHYAMLDRIDIFIREQGATEFSQQLTLGDHLPFRQRPLQHPEFIAPFTLASTAPHDIYLRVESKGSIQVPVSVQNPDYFWQHDRNLALLEAGSYFICLIMALYNFMLFLFLRDRSYLFYVLYILFFVAALGTNRGWSYQFLWPTLPRMQDFGIVFCTLMAIASACAFATGFMRLNRLAPRLHRLVSGMSIAGVVLAIATLALDYRIAIQIMVGFSLTCSVALAIVASSVWYRTHSRQAALYCISWLFLLTGVALYMGNKFALLPVNLFTNEGLRWGALLEIVFLSFALADRVNQDRAATEQAQRQVIQMQLSMNAELEKQVKSRTQELEYLNHLLHQASITDALTTTANRRHFDDAIDKEFRRAMRDGTALSLLMVDLDFFKKINDTHGHLVGDKCLQLAARALLDCIKRPPDLVARYGGEEFAVLLPNTPLAGAQVVADQMLERIRALQIDIPSGEIIRITVSIGVASAQPRQGDAHPPLIHAADTALYEAKHRGRNQAVAAPATLD